MKFTKLCLMFTAATLAVGAFADARNVLVSFSTEADFYADGDKVADGEWYALCWSPRETFGGITLDFKPVVEGDEILIKPVVEGDEILILAPLAEDGHCPSVIFQVDSQNAPTGGVYFVYLLDTRDVTGTAPAAAKKDESGRLVPSVVNGSAAAQSFTASASVGSNIATETSAVAGDWAAVQPKITAFEVKEAKVKITVAGMMRGLNYKVSMGGNLDEMESFEVKAQNEDGKAFFIIDPKDARFFKVVAE